MADKKIRGDLIKGYFSSVKKFWGEKGLKKCEEYLGVEEKDLKGSVWYPLKYHKKMHEFLSNRGEKYVIMAARHTTQNLGMLAYLVQFVSIKRLLKKAPKSYYDTFNFGDIEIDIGENSALVKLDDVMFAETSCLAWKGAFLGALDATNTKGTVEIIDHEDKGDEDCFIKIEW
ncbi:MAG: hypothetical protein ACOC1V_03370 [Candidatus Saliniplasma sp.]